MAIRDKARLGSSSGSMPKIHKIQQAVWNLYFWMDKQRFYTRNYRTIIQCWFFISFRIKIISMFDNYKVVTWSTIHLGWYWLIPPVFLGVNASIFTWQLVMIWENLPVFSLNFTKSNSYLPLGCLNSKWQLLRFLFPYKSCRMMHFDLFGKIKTKFTEPFNSFIMPYVHTYIF